MSKLDMLEQQKQSLDGLLNMVVDMIKNEKSKELSDKIMEVDHKIARLIGMNLKPVILISNDVARRLSYPNVPQPAIDGWITMYKGVVCYEVKGNNIFKVVVEDI